MSLTFLVSNFFLSNGYFVTALDASEKLLELKSDYEQNLIKINQIEQNKKISSEEYCNRLRENNLIITKKDTEIIHLKKKLLPYLLF